MPIDKNMGLLADVVAIILVPIVDVFDRGIAIVGLALARIRADTLVGAGGCSICFGQNSSLLLLLRRRP